MANGTTIALLAIVGLLVIYYVGFRRTAGGAARAARSTYTAGAVGLGLGLQFGADLVGIVMSDPFAVLTAIAGIFGALGIEGIVNISGAQFLLIGVTVFLLVWMISHGRSTGS